LIVSVLEQFIRATIHLAASFLYWGLCFPLAGGVQIAGWYRRAG
jgi:hypothetical protein